MTEMVERVAKAILDKVPDGYGMTEAEAIMYSRAAIKAMREPTEAMRSNAYADPWPKDATMFWQAMIDEALREKNDD